MKVSGINMWSKDPGIIKDELTGLPTGFIRASAFAILEIPANREISQEEWIKAFTKMMLKYNQYGITSICAGTGDFKTVRMYREMADSNILTVRILQNILLQTDKSITRELINRILNGYPEVTGAGDKWVRIGPLKVFLDGGILTGTAFMEEPWGEKAFSIYNIKDPSYRGIINFSRDELLAIVSAANVSGWSFTAHVTGDGAVNLLLDVYKEVNRESSIRGKRFSIIHGNFFNNEAVALMKEMDIYANIQAAWFYKDADAMNLILGEEKIRIFHPNRSMLDAGIMLNGGSDHMVKLDANSSVNPYNPFLAMWSMITRKTERGSVILPEEAITREEALKIYTINNAFASFEESIKGSIEPGKLADLAIINKDILTCPVDSIRVIESLMTIVGGKIVYTSENQNN
jgi:predicted amidohydrolase YtcJ